MTDDGEDRFLTRWARRKRESAQPERPPDEAVPAPAQAAPERREDEAQERAAVDPPSDLPDPDTLSETADFTVFLKKGVPDALRRRALRRLWRLNPVFANLDGLNDYDEDYTDAARVVDGLKTLYQAGRGMMPPEEDVPADTASAQGDEPPATNIGDERSRREADAGEALLEPGPAEETQQVVPPSAEPESAPGSDPAEPGGPRGEPAKAPVSRALARRWGLSDS